MPVPDETPERNPVVAWLRRWGLVLLVALLLGYLVVSTWGERCHYNAPLRKLLCTEAAFVAGAPIAVAGAAAPARRTPPR